MKKHLTNGCSHSEFTVKPTDWHTKKAKISFNWYIKYRFYDPSQAKPKQVMLKGMNSFKSLIERQEETKRLLEFYKYDGTYEEIGDLIKEYVPASMVTLEQYFKLLVFNYVISNGDAHLKNFSLIRNELKELNLSPAYDLMSTILHTPGEGDTALGLFDKDYDSAYNLTYGHYGRMEFIELARRLGLVELRYLRILNEFIEKRESIIQFIDNSLLSNKAKEIFLKNLFDKLSRIK